jgi:methyltransferase (TIGR00027 family)
MINETESVESKIDRKSPSKMAEGMAMHRYNESLKSKEERLCYDPYAIHFINPKIVEYGKNNPEKAKYKIEEMEKIFPGLSSSILARVRYFDDFVDEQIGKGLEQLVILGAGYDTRAYRIEELKKNIKVFEVDHPNTQSFKIQKINELFGTVPDYVTYVPVDLETQELSKNLMINGYKSNKKTLFIMEGLIMYIPQKSIEKIFSFIVKNSGSGSSIIFDYYPESVVNGSCKLEIAKNIRKFVVQQSEPLQFGIEDGRTEEFLANNGFKQIKNIRSEDYKKAYFHGENQNRMVCDLLSFVQAIVE